MPQQRGFVSFLPLPEENVACNGKTVAATLDDTLEDPLGYTMGVINEDKSASFGSRRRRLSVKVSYHAHALGRSTCESMACLAR